MQPLLQRQPHIRDVGTIYLGVLMQPSNPSLDDLRNGHSLVDGPSHGLQYYLHCRLGRLSEEVGGIGDVVPHFPLSSNTDFILLDIGELGLWLLFSSVLIHR